MSVLRFDCMFLGKIRGFVLLFCLVFSASAISSCSHGDDSPSSRTELWGVFKTGDGVIVAAGGETSDFTVCNQGYRSTATNIELKLWTIVFQNSSAKIYDTISNRLLATGVLFDDRFTADANDRKWSFSADFREADCCFDGTDGISAHWHGIKMPDYLAPETIGKQACDSGYTDWYDRWTSRLYGGSTVVETRAGPTEYAIIGDSGPVLAFMHGGPGNYYSAIASFSDLMGKGFRFLTWSRPGFLRTPLSTGETPEAQADALAALLDTLSIDKVAMVGASAGGPPAYQFAIRHPDRIWAIVQVDAVSQAYSPGAGEKPGEATWITLLQQNCGMWLYNAMFEYANLGTARQFIGMMSTLDDAQNDALAESVAADKGKLEMLGNVLLSMSPNSLLMEGTFNDISHYMDMPPMSLEKIRAPTLIVHGTADGDVPPEDAVYAASRIVDAELYWVEGGVHIVTLSPDSNVVMTKILDFLVLHSPDRLFSVEIESGERTTSTGDKVGYDLYVPKFASGLPKPPCPAVILTHGFSRSKKFEVHNAEYLAERGIITMTPNMTSLLPGESAQRKNIQIIQDHAAWLVLQAQTPGSLLYGMLDPERIALAGHSAGGAVSFEAGINMQESGPNIAALCLLDAVPWSRTVARAPNLKELPFCSLRSEPSACNDYGKVLELTGGLGFSGQDVRIVGATHCDAENPSDAICAVLCGGQGESQRAIYQRLMYLFFQDALKATSVETPPQSYQTGLNIYAASGAIKVNVAQSGH